MDWNRNCAVIICVGLGGFLAAETTKASFPYAECSPFNLPIDVLYGGGSVQGVICENHAGDEFLTECVDMPALEGFTPACPELGQLPPLEDEGGASGSGGGGGGWMDWINSQSGGGVHVFGRQPRSGTVVVEEPINLPDP